MERYLEDKIYNLLRKTRIITNICINSLFAIQAQSPFVFISTRDSTIRNQEKFFTDLLVNFCETGQIPASSPFDDKLGNCDNESNHSTRVIQNGQTHPIPRRRLNEAYADDSERFSDFLWSHVETALERGFDDNIGKQMGTMNLFEVPTASQYLDVLLAMKDALFVKPSENIKTIIENLRFSFDVDSRFTAGFVTHPVPTTGVFVGAMSAPTAVGSLGAVGAVASATPTTSILNLSQN